MSEFEATAATLAGAGNAPARADELVPAAASAMRARRHPSALAGMWVWETALALVASWPAASLARAAYGGDPHGDAPLWGAGGHALLDLLWHDAHGISVLLFAGAFALTVGLFAGLVPLAALMTAMAFRAPDGRPAGLARSLAAGVRAFRPFAVLLVAFGAVEGLVVGAGVGASSLTEGMTHAGLGEAHAQLLEGGMVVPFLLGASLVGVAHDLARAAVVHAQVNGLRGLVLGARALRSAPVQLWWSWAWRAAAAGAPVVAATVVATDVRGRGALALVLLALVHQAIVLTRVALRASWLGRALRAVDGAPRRPA